MSAHSNYRGGGPGGTSGREGGTGRHGTAARPGDWTCPSCNANVFASKHECFRCQTPRPGRMGGGVDRPGGGRGRGHPTRGGRHFARSFKATRSSREVSRPPHHDYAHMPHTRAHTRARIYTRAITTSASLWPVVSVVSGPNAPPHRPHSYIHVHYLPQVFALLETIQQEGTTLDVKIISMAVSALGRMRGESGEQAVELLRSSKSKYGVDPDVITYNAAISACEKGWQWERALELLEEMKSSGIEPDVISYSAAISACEKGGQWERALELLEEMKSRGIEPNVISYNAAISACEKGGQWERALELLEEMKSRGIEPNVISYSAAISACEKGGQWERALELLEEMKSRGIEPDVISYNAAISACEKGGQWERALELLEEMKSRGIEPRRHLVQRRHQRVREGWTVGAGAGAAGGDEEPRH